jgi:hypothetical protein
MSSTRSRTLDYDKEALMGWWIYLHDDRGHTEGEWNGTHNIGGMANTALDEAEWPNPEDETWWRVLDGLSGPEGQRMLKTIYDALESETAKYEAMNPANGWGSRARFMEQLSDMIGSVPEWPCVWKGSG